MKKFSWYEAKSIEDAMAKVNATSSDILGKEQDGKSVVFKAGGIDLLDLMKEGLVNPSTIVGVKSIPNLDKIEYSNQDGLHIGANATLGELEESSLIKEKYLALHLAVAHAGTPNCEIRPPLAATSPSATGAGTLGVSITNATEKVPVHATRRKEKTSFTPL
jgi:xanthine dehydrogenase YagS FAD-binding subunit